MGQPERFKFVRRVHIRKADNAGNLYVRVGSRHSTDAAITWDAERTLAEGESYINTSVLGRFISLGIRSQDDDEWAVSGADLEYEERGYL
jgi:hypothetical protein